VHWQQRSLLITSPNRSKDTSELSSSFQGRELQHNQHHKQGLPPMRASQAYLVAHAVVCLVEEQQVHDLLVARLSCRVQCCVARLQGTAVLVVSRC
jgi:hypothetical protein